VLFSFVVKPSKPKDTVIFNEYVFSVNDRLENGVKNNVFEGKMRVFDYGLKQLALFDLNLLFPKFFLFGFLGLVVSFLLFGFGWYSVFLLCFGCLGVLWTKFPYFLLLKRGLKKKGFEGRINLL